MVVIHTPIAEAQPLFPHSHLVQAFVGLTESDFALPFPNQKTIDCPLIGQNAHAIEMVKRLTGSAGILPAQ